MKFRPLENSCIKVLIVRKCGRLERKQSDFRMTLKWKRAKKKQKQETNGNRSFSLTWPTSMQIYWNKRKRLHKKRVQLPQEWFGTPIWPSFHCFGTPIWPPWRHAKTLHRTIWLVYRTDTNARGFWLVKRTLGWKNFMPENFLEINRYFPLTTYCNTIGQSNNNFSTLGFFLARKRRVHVLIFSSIGW